jgi:division protein CdvB (Snf7/Vps24/ESCRT-III family)
MSDNKDNRNSPDSRRINVNETYELENWSKKFDLSHQQLQNAVREARTSVQALGQWLKNNSGNGRG